MRENGAALLVDPKHPVARAYRVQRWHNRQLQPGQQTVAEEVPVALVYNGISHAVMLATPDHLEDFGLGFSLTEGILHRRQDLFDVEISEQRFGIEVRMTIAGEQMFRLKEKRRSLAGRTGCGLCGTESLQEVLRQPAAVSNRLAVSVQALHKAFDQLTQHQPLHQATGAVHAAAWADAEGTLQFVREDVGRHNALDKMVGAAVRQGIDPGSGFAIVTSRASYEMVLKAASAGVPLLAAISAPTGLATRLAVDSGLTLVGFARKRTHVVYAHAQRLHPGDTDQPLK